MMLRASLSRWVAVCGAVTLFAWCSSASAQVVNRAGHTILVPVVPDSSITVDGSLADWPMADFNDDVTSDYGIFPTGFGPAGGSFGDHMVFDADKVGNFSLAGTATNFRNDTTDGSDHSAGLYMVFDSAALYLAEVCIDNSVSAGGSNFCCNWQSDGFEIYLDTKNDSVAPSCFPSAAAPCTDDHQLTWGINSFASSGADSDYARGGDATMFCDMGACGTPNTGGYMTALIAHAGAGNHTAASIHADINGQAGIPDSVLDEILGSDASASALPGYVIEACVPFNFDATNDFNPITNPVMGFTGFWRDREDGGLIPAGNDWANFHQQIGASTAADTVFDTEHWGRIVFEKHTIEVRKFGGFVVTVDGDTNDWPLSEFDSDVTANYPVFPGGFGPLGDYSGDHMIFDADKVGNFSLAGTATNFRNDTTDGSDHSAGLYMMYDESALYLLEVCIDNSVSAGGSNFCCNWQSDGFEIYLDMRNDSARCFPGTAPTCDDDHQLTWGINSFAASGADSDYARGGDATMFCDMGACGTPNTGGYMTALNAHAGAGNHTAAAIHADMNTSGIPDAVLDEILGGDASASVLPGYVIEACVPFDFDALNAFNPVTNPRMGFSGFWRDREDGGLIPAGNDWANFHQQIGASTAPDTVFDTGNWGDIVFSDRGFNNDRGNFEVRPFGGAGSGGGTTVVVDGDSSEWPLDQFDDDLTSDYPVFPGGQLPTSNSGDHMIFDADKVGNFSLAGTATNFRNDTTDGSDHSAGLYMMYDTSALYLLEVCIDNSVSAGASNFCCNWQSDGFEMYFDTKNNSERCFPGTAPTCVDDHQLTWGINSFAASGADSDYARGGDSTMFCDMGACGTPNTGGYMTALNAHAGAGNHTAAAIHADMNTSGIPDSVLDEILGRDASAQVLPGYVLEACVPFDWDATNDFNPVTNPVWGYSGFWRDREDGGLIPAGNDWANFHQQIGASTAPLTVFDTGTWGTMTFSSRTFTFSVNLKPGDANQDGVVDMSDSVAILQFLFNGVDPDLVSNDCIVKAAAAPPPALELTATGLTICDWNGDGALDISDGTSQLTWIFLQPDLAHAHSLCDDDACTGCTAIDDDNCTETCTDTTP